MLNINGYSVTNPKITLNKKTKPVGLQQKNSLPSNNVSFGRALSTRELNELSSLIDYSRKNILKIKNMAVIMFSSMCPSEIGKNPGMGTINAKKSIEMLKHLHKSTGIDAVQLGPHGIIPGCTLSPYSGSSFSLNPRNIDLMQLTEDAFGNILDKTSKKLQKLFDNNDFDKKNINLVNKDNMDNFFDDVLEEAFQGFKKLGKKHPLKNEYNNFCKNNGNKWLDKDALYQAFSVENTDGKYVNDYWPNWHNNLDKNIFGSMVGTKQASERIKEVSQKQSEVIDLYKFKQFVTEKQHFQTKKELNESGIRVLGDCPISFSPRDQWAHMNDFEQDKFIGARNGDGSIQYWGGPLWKNAEIIEKRFDRMNDLYDGLRADAGWEYKRSVVYTGDRKHVWDGDHSRDVLDRFNASARRYGKDLSLNSIENTHGSCDVKGQLMQLNSEGFPIPEIIITAHGGFADQQIAATWAAATTHDTDSILSFTKGDTNRVTDWFAGLMKGPSNGKGSKNVLLGGNDMFGMGEKLNGYEDASKNWLMRIPTKWEEFLNGQLKNGYGFNAAEVVKRAVSWKVPEYQRSNEVWDLLGKLDNYSRIIREDGPMTTKEADKIIDHIF